MNKRYLLAVSGGVDSMVMCNLFLKSKFQFEVAHCNFQLRNLESDGDEQLVLDWCKKNHIICHHQSFNTLEFKEAENISIQEAARVLRYQYFYTLLATHSLDFIVTAHHQNDNIETVLFHFFRGTGLAGMCGIPAFQQQIIRPMLSFSKQDIFNYANQNQIIFREDSSNKKNIYTRNFFRNELLPQIEKVLPNAQQNIAQNIIRFSESYQIYKQQIESYRKKLIEKRGNDWYVPILKLKKQQPLQSITYELLKPFGFSYLQTIQILKLIDSESGRKIAAQNYLLFKDRNFFIITQTRSTESQYIQFEKQNQQIETSDFKLNIKLLSSENYHLSKDTSILQLDADKIKGTLLLRKWKQGDYLYPLGMNKKKKVARILIDEKIALTDKEKIWVVESNKNIIGIVGLKIDNRFKIESKTKKILIIQKKIKNV
ncbi:MAG: tRNA lysidine(34) synthetase TilS [Chitinophagaceae bacterium]|nr:tRNA lysidine(34) synthetase TilS [Chitinophagaceae bacterium]HMN31953.1 tRNA lysidine(34) synthetase TilS [Chitinophagaceae bacterium]